MRFVGSIQEASGIHLGLFFNIFEYLGTSCRDLGAKWGGGVQSSGCEVQARPLVSPKGWAGAGVGICMWTGGRHSIENKHRIQRSTSL